MMNAPASPRLTMRRKRPLTQGEITLRFFAMFAGILNSLALIIYVLVVITARLALRKHRIGMPLAAIGGVTVALCLWWNFHLSYIRPWQDVYGALSAHTFDAYLSKRVTVSALIVDTWDEYWYEWLWAQAPFAFALALIAAGVYLAWRDYYSDDWLDGGGSTPLVKQRAVVRAKRYQDMAIEKSEPVGTLKEVIVPLGIDAYTAKKTVNVPVDA